MLVVSTRKLYSTLEVSQALGITKQAVNQAELAGKIEAPAYKIGQFKGWTEEQILRMKKKQGEYVALEAVNCEMEEEEVIEKEVRSIVGSIPIGLTPAGWDFLKKHKEIALPTIDEAIEQCESDITKTEESGNNERLVYLPYMNSSLARLKELKEALNKI